MWNNRNNRIRSEKRHSKPKRGFHLARGRDSSMCGSSRVARPFFKRIKRRKRARPNRRGGGPHDSRRYGVALKNGTGFFFFQLFYFSRLTRRFSFPSRAIDIRPPPPLVVGPKSFICAVIMYTDNTHTMPATDIRPLQLLLLLLV